MPGCQLDHIVITAPSLQIGEDYVRRALGFLPVRGGEHVAMGTHNSLLRLGETTYLEVIAINPAADDPLIPRWFNLDAIESGDVPRLTTWVARTDDIRTLVENASLRFGEVAPMRRGPLNWLITITPDGSMPGGGIVPTLIQWQTERHPATTLPDSGCSLVRLEGFHPDAAAVSDALASLGLAGAIEIGPLGAQEQPYLVAHIQTPSGLKHLGGH